MKKEDILEKIIDLAKKVADNPELEITPSTKLNEIEDWDSLNNVDLEMSIETEFGVSFDTGEFEELKEMNTIVKAVEGKLGR